MSATLVPGWCRPKPPASCPEAVLAYYQDHEGPWLHWMDPSTNESVEGSEVEWPFVEDVANLSDLRAIGFVDCEPPLLDGLWMFVGSVPEDGDYHLVWASSVATAMAEGRRVAGYDGSAYDDSDFEVRLATAVEILLWSPALVNRNHQVRGKLFVGEGFLDTPAVRTFLASQIKATEDRMTKDGT